MTCKSPAKARITGRLNDVFGWLAGKDDSSVVYLGKQGRFGRFGRYENHMRFGPDLRVNEACVRECECGVNGRVNSEAQISDASVKQTDPNQTLAAIGIKAD